MREICAGMELLTETLSLGQHHPDGNIGGISFQDEWETWVRVHEDGCSGEHLFHAFESTLVFRCPDEFGGFLKETGDWSQNLRVTSYKVHIKVCNPDEALYFLNASGHHPVMNCF